MNAELLAQQIEEARQAGERARRTRPTAKAARYLPKERKVELTLADGKTLSIPVDLLQGLEGASDEDLVTVEVTPAGLGLHWEPLDADFLVAGLVEGSYGTKAWMQAIGAQGGKATTQAKREAAKQNGAKGGRPRDRSRRKAEIKHLDVNSRTSHRRPEFRIEHASKAFFGYLVTANGHKLLRTHSFSSPKKAHRAVVDIQTLTYQGAVEIVQRETPCGYLIDLRDPKGFTLATSNIYRNKSSISRARGKLLDLIAGAKIRESQDLR